MRTLFAFLNSLRNIRGVELVVDSDVKFIIASCTVIKSKLTSSELEGVKVRRRVKEPGVRYGRFVQLNVS